MPRNPLTIDAAEFRRRIEKLPMELKLNGVEALILTSLFKSGWNMMNLDFSSAFRLAVNLRKIVTDEELKSIGRKIAAYTDVIEANMPDEIKEAARDAAR